MARKPIPDSIKKKLFALSGNQCCFPECTERVYELENEVLLGEMCHIRAVNSSGARYDPDFPEEEVNSYVNLLVMCPTHHTTIDSNVEKYTVEALRSMKLEHERRFYNNAGLFDSSIKKLEGEIGAVSLKELEALDETIAESSQEMVLPEKKVYLPTENYIERYVSSARGEMDDYGYDLKTLSNVLNEENRLTVLGVAGSGKSVELAHLAYIHSQPDSDLFPIKIRLNVLTTQDIEELLRLEYPEFDQVPHKRLLVLLDALDEVHADFIDITCSKIEILSKKYTKSKIVVTCRNNLYITESDKRSAKIEGFSSYLIRPLQYASIYGYLRDKVTVPPEEFIEDLRKKRFYDLLYSPFYLVNLVEFYEAKKEIPASKKIVFEYLIAQRIENDYEKFANAGINIQDHSHKIHLSIREIAAVAECLGRNYLDERTEVQLLVPDQKLLEIIKRTFLFNKSTAEDRWEFEHNNFQEFLAARFLSTLSLKEIQQFVSFSPDYKKIKPSWLNTVSFLFSLLEVGEDRFKKLTDWIIKVEPDILVRFEKDKLELKIREKLFSEIYEEYESKQIIIRNEKFESEDLAMFVSDSTNIAEYLINKIELSNDRLVITEALRILHYFEYIGDYSKKIKDILEAKLCTKGLSDEIKYACLNALSNLEISDKGLTEKILEHNDLDSSQNLRAGFYRYLKSSDQFEDHMPILLHGIEHIEGVRVTVNGQLKNKSPHLSDDKYALEALLNKIENTENIKAFLEWASKYEDPSHHKAIFFEQVGKMLEKAVKSYNDSPEIFDSALNVLISFSRRYYRELGEEFLKFFNKTSTQLKAFKILYKSWQKEKNGGFDLTYGMATVCNQDCLKFIVDEINAGHFVEPRTWQFRNILGMDGRREMYDLYHQELLKINHDKYAFRNVDHEVLKKARRKRDIELLFSKEDFLSETKRIFREETETDGILKWDELCDWNRKNFNDEKMTNHIVVETLRDQAREKKFVDLKEIEELVADDSRWVWFQLNEIVQYDQNQENFEYSSEVSQFIIEWVNNELESTNFQTAIEYRKGNRYHYRYRELYASYFIQRLDIEVTENTYLDLLKVQCYLLPAKRKKKNLDEGDEERSLNTFDFVAAKLGREKVVIQALENLQKGYLVPAVKQSHFQFCQDFKVMEVAPLIYDEIFSDEWDDYDQRAFITQYIELSTEYDKLLEVFDRLGQESRLHAAKKLADSEFYPVVDKITELVAKEEDEEIISRYIQILCTIDQVAGFALQKEWILRNKRLPEHFDRFNSMDSATIDDIIEIFEDAVVNEYGTDPWSSRNDYVIALIEKGSLSEASYLRVRDQLNQWMDKYEDLKFLHYQLQNLEQKYYSKKSQVLSFDLAVELVKHQKIKSMSGEQIIKLKELERVNKKIPERYIYKEKGEKIQPIELHKGTINNRFINMLDLKASKDEVKWLTEVWRITKLTGKIPIYKEVLVNLRETLNESFNPRGINKQLIKGSVTEISLLGALIVADQQELLECADRIIRYIGQELREDLNKENFTTEEIGECLNISEKWVRIVFNLLSHGGNMWNQAGSKEGDYGYYDFKIDKNKDSVDTYIRYKDAATIISSYLQRVETPIKEFKSGSKVAWEDLIQNGEGTKTEFKSTLRICLKKNAPEKYIEHSAFKNLAAFLNTEGGMLFIGVDDNGNILGLDDDFNSFKGENKEDEFLKHFDNLVENYFGNQFSRYFKIEFPIIQGKKIAVVETKEKAPRPGVLLTNKEKGNQQEFYVRRFASAKALTIYEYGQYINTHWAKS